MADIMGNVSNLVRNETDLARAEIGESLTKAGASLGSMAVALVLAITALNVLAAALVALLVQMGLEPLWASVLVGLGLLAIAFAVFASAKSALKQIGFVPTRTARNVSRDVAAIKESLNDR
ncbi:phage holin family protein [Pseudotabrizicola formosa]|uniref:phage holin family protein n=1 Tax=Pseudotabrizicola formosa TaxID=2030009 RepID=UPI000CD14D5B|nr:phage holin family protein [Pseudotabrizicola formosa]